MYVAVVMTKTGKSMRPHGDFAAFVHEDRDTAIENAMKAIGVWTSRPTSCSPSRYHIEVGTLTDRVEEKPKFRLVPIAPPKPVECGVVKEDLDG